MKISHACFAISPIHWNRFMVADNRVDRNSDVLGIGEVEDIHKAQGLGSSVVPNIMRNYISSADNISQLLKSIVTD